MKYYTKKVYNTDIHIFESGSKECVITVTGETNREKVEDIHHDWFEKKGYTQVMGINCSFFGWDKKSNPVGHVFVDRGFWKRGLSSNDSFNELIYQNGILIIDDVPCKEEMERRYPERSWSLGLGHTLTINGKIDIRKAEKFDHAKYPNPRTMIGQKADGTVVFVVTDGRSRSDRGLTAQEQAEFMYSLECVNSINCDGGGSSTMVVEGKMVNDNENRKVANGIFVYAKKAMP